MYLGSILSDDCSLNSEIENPTKAASSAFGRLLHRVFLNHNLAISTKLAVYKAVCISVLLYGCEAWTPYRRHIKTLEAFHIRCLQTILGVRWWQKVPHVELFSKVNITPVEHLLVQRQLRWLGHVIRLPDNRLPRRLLNGELSQGQRSVGHPKRRFSDYIRITLQKCNIQLSDLEASATEMSGGLCVKRAYSMNGWINTSMKRRTARHASTAKTKTGPRCPQCGRHCASDFGLRSHLRSHASTRPDNS